MCVRPSPVRSCCEAHPQQRTTTARQTRARARRPTRQPASPATASRPDDPAIRSPRTIHPPTVSQPHATNDRRHRRRGALRSRPGFPAGPSVPSCLQPRRWRGGPPDRLPPTADRGDAAPSPTNPARPSLVRAFVTPAWRRTRGGAGKQRLTAHRPSGINSRCGPWIPQGPHSRTRPPASGSRRPKW